jgi:FAD binding domain/Berberine and berberine like
MPFTRRTFLKSSAAGAVALGAGFPELAGGAPTKSQINALRGSVNGRVYAPGDQGYNSARKIYNKRFDSVKPPAVVRVHGANDIQAVVRWANKYDVQLVGRGGGHAYNGGSTSKSAVVVDTGGLDRVQISGHSVTAGPGTQMIDLYKAVTSKGLIVPGGSCPTVGLGGLVLGGGMGLAGRALGLTIDAVKSFRVVTADGKRKTVDATKHKNLFWALRGGGGSFAILWEIELKATHRKHASWFSISYPAGSRDEALEVWGDVAPKAPSALTAICTIFDNRATAFGQYLGSESNLRQIIAPLTQVPGAQVSVGSGSMMALQKRWAGCAGESVSQCRQSPRELFDASSVYIAKTLPAAGRSAMIRAADSGAILICDAYGGAISDVSATATAFAHRDVKYSVQIASYATPLGKAKSIVNNARAMIAPFGNGGAYPNYADLALDHPQQDYYGQNLARLKRIKKSVDPDNRFKTAQGIH